ARPEDPAAERQQAVAAALVADGLQRRQGVDIDHPGDGGGGHHRAGSRRATGRLAPAVPALQPPETPICGSTSTSAGIAGASGTSSAQYFDIYPFNKPPGPPRAGQLRGKIAREYRTTGAACGPRAPGTRQRLTS